MDSCRVGVFLSLLFHVVLVYCIICNVILFFRLIESFVYPTLAAFSLAALAVLSFTFPVKDGNLGVAQLFFLAPKLEIPLDIGDTYLSPFINKYFAEYEDCLCLRDISSERLCKQQLNSLINSFSSNTLFLYMNFT